MKKEKNRNVDLLYKLLGVWEDDQKINEEDRTFLTCLDKTIMWFSGIESEKAKTIKTFLKGMRNEYDELTHAKVKSLVFNCIDIEKRK